MLNLGEWYHIFGSYDSKTVKAYVDGKLEGEMEGNDAVHKTDGLLLLSEAEMDRTILLVLLTR